MRNNFFSLDEVRLERRLLPNRSLDTTPGCLPWPSTKILFRLPVLVRLFTKIEAIFCRQGRCFLFVKSKRLVPFILCRPYSFLSPLVFTLTRGLRTPLPPMLCLFYQRDLLPSEGISRFPPALLLLPFRGGF